MLETGGFDCFQTYHEFGTLSHETATTLATRPSTRGVVFRSSRSDNGALPHVSLPLVNLDEAAARLRDATCLGAFGEAKPKNYSFFLLEKRDGGVGLFCWYDTKAGLLDALANDLIGFDGSTVLDESAAATFQQGVAAAIAAHCESLETSDALQRAIDKLLMAPWHIPFIGTYTGLLSGNDSWARKLRERFRKKAGLPVKTLPGAPIEDNERSDFEWFVTREFY
jgi:hypothetical protein